VCLFLGGAYFSSCEYDFCRALNPLPFSFEEIDFSIISD
jgi:hypothetical protein